MKAEKSTNKAPPPPAPTKTKAPPENITPGKQLEVPPRAPTTRSDQLEEDSICSSGVEEHGNIIAGPIDLTKPEQITGPHNRMKLAISKAKDILERADISRNKEAHTFKIICGPGKLGRILTEMANEPTQATLCDLEMPDVAYYAAVITYVNNYICQIEDPPNQATPNSGK